VLILEKQLVKQALEPHLVPVLINFILLCNMFANLLITTFTVFLLILKDCFLSEYTFACIAFAFDLTNVLLLHITPLKAFAKLFTDVLNGSFV
jgi:hypothetical protein